MSPPCRVSYRVFPSVASPDFCGEFRRFFCPFPNDIYVHFSYITKRSMARQESGLGIRIEGARLRNARMLETRALGSRARDAGWFDIGCTRTHQPKRGTEGRVGSGVE